MLNHTVSHLYKLRKKKGHKKLGKRKKGICFFGNLKATAWSVTKPQIKGLNTELWKLKRNSTHLELNRVCICDDRTVLRVPVSVNRKTWLKGLSGRNTKPEDTYTSMRPQTKLELETIKYPAGHCKYNNTIVCFLRYMTDKGFYKGSDFSSSTLHSRSAT